MQCLGGVNVDRLVGVGVVRIALAVPLEDAVLLDVRVLLRLMLVVPMGPGTVVLLSTLVPLRMALLAPAKRVRVAVLVNVVFPLSFVPLPVWVERSLRCVTLPLM